MARKLIKPDSKPTHEEIARRAYEIFEQRGCPEGCDQEHWLEAEAQLTADRKSQKEQITGQKGDGISIPAKPAARQQFGRS